MKKYVFFISVVIGAVLFLFPHDVEARPEYAVKLGITDCMTCHYSPSGGGPRNENGKFYGWRSKNSFWDNTRKYWHIDLRMNGLYPQRPTKNTNGVAMMSATVGASAPLSVDAQNKPLSQIVLTYDTGLAKGTRDAYIQFLPESQYGVWTVGKFSAPFGLLTDEHRAFTRLQTKTTLNNYEMGMMFSSNWSQATHFDLALTSGFAQAGDNFTVGSETTPEQTGAATVNLRSSPGFWPGFLGLSYSNHQSLIVGQVQMASLYTGVSFERLKGFLPLHIQGEVVWGQGTNNQKYNGTNMSQFSNDPLVQAAWEKSISLGAGAEVNADLNPQWTLQYRYDRLAPDNSFPGDVFVRHGVGFKHFLNSNANLLVRYEKADSNVKEVPEQTVRANKDSFYLILHAWL